MPLAFVDPIFLQDLDTVEGSKLIETLKSAADGDVTSWTLCSAPNRPAGRQRLPLPVRLASTIATTAGNQSTDLEVHRTSEIDGRGGPSHLVFLRRSGTVTIN